MTFPSGDAEQKRERAHDSDNAAPCGRRLHELRRLHFGELTLDAKAELEQHLAICPACGRRLTAMESAETTFLKTTNVAAESANILLRLEGVSGSAWAWRAAALALTLSAVALVPTLYFRNLHVRDTERTAHRIKGEAVSLEMFIKVEGGVRHAEDGEALHPGDQIQFRYKAGGLRYVLILSVDGHRVISPLYPDRVGESVRVSPEGEHVLAGSVILDDALGPERIFALFSVDPLAFEEVERIVLDRLGNGADVTALHSLAMGRYDVEETTLLILKE